MMEKQQHAPDFEAIKQVDAQGMERWSARQLMKLLGYSKWERFEGVIERAKEACRTSGNQVEDHFPSVGKLITKGKGASQSIKDYALSRLACYLIAQNGDPRKGQIAAAQLYFAVQTRRQELADQQREEDMLAGLTEDQRRLIIRDQLRERQHALAQTAHDIAGIVTPRDHGTFMNAGYKGL